MRLKNVLMIALFVDISVISGEAYFEGDKINLDE